MEELIKGGVMNWEIISYGNADYLRFVFNGVAAIFGNSDYKVAIATSAMLGFIVVMIRAAFDKALFNNFKHIIAMVIIYMSIMVPKTNVIITDKILPTNSSVVNNVPLGLAATAGFFSMVGDYLTRSFETVFSLPSQVSYSKNGLLFGHRMLEASRTFKIHDSRIQSNLNEFFSSCVVIDGIGNNRFTWDEVINSNNLLNFLGSRVAKNVASFKYTYPSGAEAIFQCRDGFNLQLKPEILALNNNTLLNSSTVLIRQTGGAASAASKMTTDLPPALQFVTGISTTTKDLAVQNSLINGIEVATINLSQQLEAREFSQYNISRATLERMTTYQAIGNIAADKLPLLKGLFEAFLYSIFPIIMMMAMVIPKSLFLYAKGLVWINLWPCIYAIINFALIYYSKGTMTDIALLKGSGFSAVANTQLAEISSDMVATAGYLSMALPTIAWMLISSSGAMAASFAGRVMEGYDKSVGKGSEEMVSGKGSSLGQDFRYTSEGGVQTTSISNSGTELTNTANGQTFFKAQQSTSSVSLKTTQQSVERAQSDYSSAVANQNSVAKDYTESVANLKNVSAQVTDSIQSGFKSGQINNDSASKLSQVSKNEIQSAMDSFQKSTGITLSNEAKAQITAGFSTPFGGIQGSASAARLSKDDLAATEQFMNSSQYASALSKTLSHVTSNAKEFGFSENDALVIGTQDAINRVDSTSMKYSQAVTQTEQASKTLTNAKIFSEIAESGQLDLAKNALMAQGRSMTEIDGLLSKIRDTGDKDSMNEILNAVYQYSAESGTSIMVDDFEEGFYGRVNQIKQNYESEKGRLIDQGAESIGDAASDYTPKNIAPITGSVNDAIVFDNLHNDSVVNQTLTPPNNNTKEKYEDEKKKNDPVEQLLEPKENNYSVTNPDIYGGFGG